MRIDYIWIEEYKNLKNFEMYFNEKNGLNLIIGKNGSGKSNFLEVLSKIFCDLNIRIKLALDRVKEFSEDGLIDFSYRLIYKDKTKKEIEIIKQNNDVKVLRNKDIVAIEEIQNDIPEKIFAYYSGKTHRLPQIFKNYGKWFQNYTDLEYEKGDLEEIKSVEREYIMPNMISFSDTFLPIFLMSYFLLSEEKIINIHEISSFKITFNTPTEALKNLNQSEYLYGDALEIFSILEDSGKVNYGEFKNTSSISYEKNSIENLVKRLKELYMSPKVLFEYLVALRYSSIIKTIEVEIKKENYNCSYKELSEGEKQFLTIDILLKIYQETGSMFLFDEPDTYLHPEWQRKLALNLDSYKNSTLLMTTHSPLALGVVDKESIILFKDNKTGTPISESRNRDISDILKEVMGVGSRPENIEKMISKFYELLADNKLKEANFKLEKMRKILDLEDPFIIEAEMYLDGCEF